MVDGALRNSGVIKEKWDGWDEAHVVQLKNHPKLIYYAEGFRLSKNTIMVVKDNVLSKKPTWMDLKGKPAEIRTKGEKPKGLNMHAYHDRETCHDFTLKMTLPENVPRNKDGLPIISGATQFRIEMEEEDALLVESQRYEVVYYLNNQLIYENEASYMPYTWTWDPKVLAGGVNYMTAMIFTFGGHYGVTTVKFELAKAGNK